MPLRGGCQRRYYVLDLQRNDIREFSRYMSELHARGHSHAGILKSARDRDKEARGGAEDEVGVEPEGPGAPG